MLDAGCSGVLEQAPGAVEVGLLELAEGAAGGVDDDVRVAQSIVESFAGGKVEALPGDAWWTWSTWSTWWTWWTWWTWSDCCIGSAWRATAGAADLVAGGDELGEQDAAEISGASGDEDVHGAKTSLFGRRISC